MYRGVAGNRPKNHVSFGLSFYRWKRLILPRFGASGYVGVMSTSMATWHALYCEPQRELFARDRLIEQGVEVFCPYERTVKRKSVAGRPGQYRTYKVDVPVYAPYIFANTDQFLLVKNIPGVINIVGICGMPLNVPDKVIDKLKSIVDEKGLVEKDVSKPSFWFEGRIGDQFEFSHDSPLAGFIGTIASVEKLDEGEIKALVRMLGGELDVVVPLSTVTTIRHKGGEGDGRPLRP